MPTSRKLQAVLFDLDGTFADTAPDLANALNIVLENHQHEKLAFEQIRPVVSHGGQALIKLGFKLDKHDAEFEPLRQELLDIYRANLVTHTRLFPGIEDILIYIQSRQMKWGIVTNKPAWLTEPLMQGLDLTMKPDCIVSGDTLAQRKPDPAPLLHACELISCSATNSVYIGDAERDIVAGKSAGMLTCAALFGYIGTQDSPDTWGADKLAASTQEIISWLQEYAN